MEQTLFIIKPDAVGSKCSGRILEMVENAGFRIIELRMFQFDSKTASEFYAMHKEKPFFNDLLTFVTSSKCIACVLEKENAISDLRTLVGETDPSKSPPATIRRCFGTDIQMNAVHASDSMENAKREIDILFG
ncbi:MAG: nucleoside-diphosphate kinase [Candidatus Cloacimonadota bacterium]|nr:MAG: nucleoside-diphosphate kinase [Candidatus Cloacimonadota bacterium]